MPTCSFRDLERVCAALGLECRQAKKGTVWKGVSPFTGAPIAPISIHDHAGGKDVPDGTLGKYIKELGFKNIEQFRDYLNRL